MMYYFDLNPNFTEKEVEAFRKLHTEKNATKYRDMVTNIYTIFEDHFKCKRLHRKDINLRLSKLENEEDKDIYKFFRGCERLLFGYYVPPNRILINYSDIVYGVICLRHSPTYKRYCKQYTNVNSKSLSLKDMIYNFTIEVLIHEMLHANQYALPTYGSNETAYLKAIEIENETETIVFIVQYYYKLMETLNYVPCKLNYAVGKALRNLMYYCEATNKSYIEILKSEEPEDMGLKRKFACQAYRKYHRIGHYKKASLEYILAVRLVLERRGGCYERYPDQVYNLIDEARESIRNCDYFVFDDIIWKKDGRYINQYKN